MSNNSYKVNSTNAKKRHGLIPTSSKMHKANIQKIVVIGLVLLSILYGLVEGYLALNGQTTSEHLHFGWSIAFALFIALWAANDETAEDLYQSYEYLYFVLLLWPIFLPYHLVKTRGMDGVLMFSGILGIYLLPFLCGLATSAYFT